MSGAAFTYDVFLSHNQADKAAGTAAGGTAAGGGACEIRNSKFGIRHSKALPVAGGAGIGLGGAGAQHRWEGQLALSRSGQRRPPLHPAPAGRLQTPGHAAADLATGDIAIGSKLSLHGTKPSGESFKRSWPPLIKWDAAVKAKVSALFGNGSDNPRGRSYPATVEHETTP